jgi:hypothetical protein
MPAPAPSHPVATWHDISDEPRQLVVYLRPPGNFQAMDARVTALAIRHVRHVRVEIVRPGDTSRSWVGRITQPSVMVFRCGECIAQAIGDLPLHDLEDLITPLSRQRRVVTVAA